jgi:hypothetical protein
LIRYQNNKKKQKGKALEAYSTTCVALLCIQKYFFVVSLKKLSHPLPGGVARAAMLVGWFGLLLVYSFLFSLLP